MKGELMRLTDIMSSLRLDAYAEIGLIIFLIVFASVVVRVLFMNRNDADEIAKLPLDDDETDPVRFSKDQKHGA